MLGWAQSRSGRFGEEKDLFPQPGFEYLIRLPWLSRSTVCISPDKSDVLSNTGELILARAFAEMCGATLKRNSLQRLLKPPSI
jgi:hypothetical protein